MTIRIRDAEPRHFDQIQAIYAQAVLEGTASFEQTPPSADDLIERSRSAREAGLPYLVALDPKDTVLGYAYASSYRPRKSYEFTIENSVYVRPTAQGQGVGSALLAELLARCEAGPWHQMIAVIGDSGNAGSIALHRRHGFEHVGILRRVGFKFGRWLDSVIMQRALKPEDSAAISPPD